MNVPVIDTHLHLWDLDAGEYAWLGPQHGALYRSFLPAEAARELGRAGVAGAVLVQAEDSESDTRFLLDVADRCDFVLGVVGWVRLDEPASAERQLEEYGGHPAFCGVRHLVHDDPRDDFLELRGVRESLDLLARRGLPLDVPDAWPRHLERLPDLADAVPGLTVVVDHLGKPPRGTGDLGRWADALRQVARRPNVVAKVSGLQMPGQPFTAAALRPVWDLALDVFGVERLMYGGDWPMTEPAGGYGTHWEAVVELVGELSRDEQAAVLHRTAASVYGLAVPDAR